MCKAIRSIIGLVASGALLIRSLGSLRSLRSLWVLGSRRLLLVLRRVGVVHKVSRRCKASTVWLLLCILTLALLLSSLGLRWEYGIRKGGGGGRKGTIIELRAVVVVKVQMEPIASVVHVEGKYRPGIEDSVNRNEWPLKGQWLVGSGGVGVGLTFVRRAYRTYTALYLLVG